MALGGKHDTLLAHAAITVQALQKLRELAEAAQHPGAKALLDAELELGEIVDADVTGRRLSGAFGKATTAALTLLGNAPLTMYAGIADVYEGIAPALRQMGHEDVADGLADAAEGLRETCC